MADVEFDGLSSGSSSVSGRLTTPTNLEGASAGSSPTSGEMIAAQFIEATVAAGAGGSASPSTATGNLSSLVEGAAEVTAALDPLTAVTGGADAAASVAAAVTRGRNILGDVPAAASVQGEMNRRSGVAGVVPAGADVEGPLGLKRPISAAAQGAGAVRGLLQTSGTMAQDIFLQVTGAPTFNNDADPTTGNPGTWSVPVTTRRGGAAGTRIPTGAAVVRWGQYSASSTTDFTGGLLLTSDLTNAPYMDVFTVAKNDAGVMPWHNAAVKSRVRMGNLRGVLGNATDKWGIAMSTDLSDPDMPYLEASNEGLKIQDADLVIINGTLYVGDQSGTQYMWWDGNEIEIAGDGSGVTNIYGGNIQTGSITADKLTILDGGEIRFGNLDRNAVNLSTFSGLRMYKSGSTYEMAGYNAGTKQAYFNSQGQLVAGGGVVSLDASGIKIQGTANFLEKNAITWETGGVRHSRLWGQKYGVADMRSYFTNVETVLDNGAQDPSTTNSVWVALRAKNNVHTMAGQSATIDLIAESRLVGDTGSDYAQIVLNARNDSEESSILATADKLLVNGEFYLDERIAPTAVPSGYGALYFTSATYPWPTAKTSDARSIPLGMSEVLLPVMAFARTIGAANAFPVANHLAADFRDGFVDVIDTNFVVPTAWIGLGTFYIDVYWYSVAAGNMQWYGQVRREIIGNNIFSASSYSASVLTNTTGSLVKVSTMTVSIPLDATVTSMALRLYRDASIAVDTIAGSVYLLGVRIRAI